MRHILENPCQCVRCYCLNSFVEVCFQGVSGSWFVLVNSPFQISPQEIIRWRQIGRARWPKSLRNDAVADKERFLRVATIRRTTDTHYRHIPLHFSHNERTPLQISLQYLHWC